MTEGAFWSSYSESINLLKDLNLYKNDNSHKGRSYSFVCRDYSRDNDYKALYQQLVDNLDYDILLYDDSMIQMSYEKGEYRLMYIQNPLEFITFEAFLEDNELSDLSDDKDLLFEKFHDDYEQILEEMKLNSGALYIRYDVDSRGRKDNENIHAFTHLHIGLKNNVRIPVGCYMSPLAFTTFVIRHVYYDKWVDAVRRSKIKFNHKNQCVALPVNMWTHNEMKDFYLQ